MAEDDRMPSAATLAPIPGLAFTTVAIPATASEPDWADFRALGRAENFELIGTTDWDHPDDEALELARTTEATGTRLIRLLARLDGVPVGSGLGWATIDEPDTMNLSVWIAPEYRSRGIGARLAADLLDRALAEPGITKLHSWQHVVLPPDAADRPQWSPSNGIGSLPDDVPGMVLMRRFGFALAQVVTVNRFDFRGPAADPAATLEAALAAAGPDYRIHTWEGRTPARWEDDVAYLKARMFTDAPTGDFDPTEVEWDADRLRREEGRFVDAFRRWVTAAEHVPTGRLVAFSELHTRRAEPSKLTEQQDTLVIAEHRGHRLGLAVKAANLVAVAREVPDAGPIITWNAAENTHMLAVNRQLGFVPFLVEGGFTRR